MMVTILIGHCDVAYGDWKHSWTIKVTGDAQMYKEENKKVASTSGIIVIKSLVWPGAYILYQNDRWFNFYVGSGHKADQADYYPVLPPLPQFEPGETAEYPEPNPKEDPNKPKEVAPGDIKSILATLEEVLNNPGKFNEFLTKTFDSIDVDKSGQIDPKEADNFLKAFIKELGVPVEPDPKAVDEFFRLFDKDKSGTISKEELVEPLKALIQLWSAVMGGMMPAPS